MKDERLCSNPFKKWPRNLPCFCGSGKKFKKCCNDKIGGIVKYSEYSTLKQDFNRMLEYIEDRWADGLGYKLKKPIL